ncbi:MAG: hypothetical protein HC898_08565 [Phycisphaerales bacterium]|nr:hypothetical protein [Phycisphaerales bacterium]
MANIMGLVIFPAVTRHSGVLRTGHHSVGWILLVLVLIGCATEPGLSPQDNPEVVFRHWQENSSSVEPDRALALVKIQRIDLPGAATLSRAQERLQEVGLEEAEVRRWQTHGMHLGSLDKDAYGWWLLRLPAWLEGWQSRMLVDEAPLPLVRSPGLGRSKVELMLETGDAGTTRTVTLEGGRLQLLLKVRRVAAGQYLLELVPHHNRPQVSFEPRLRPERELDGLTFPELRLLAAMDDGRILVMSLAQPVNDPTPPSGTPPLPGDQADDPVVAVEAASESLDRRNWGRYLLAHRAKGKLVQSVLILSIEDFNPPQGQR